mmetsp:Transcript_7571/g.14013  ORF Transcript_7571/g.14013 Transcript_7571/m.14013 type:complete len:422 (-) Transcript_7571:32-1297(-)
MAAATNETLEDQTDGQVNTVVYRHALSIKTVHEETTSPRQPDDNLGSVPTQPCEDLRLAVRKNAREIRNLREDVLSLHRITSDLIWVTKLEEKARETAVNNLEDRISRERTAQVIMLNCLEQKQDCLEKATKRWVGALGRDCLGTREQLSSLDTALDTLGKSSIAAKEQLMNIDASLGAIGIKPCSEMAKSETASQLDGLDGEMAQLRESLGGGSYNVGGGEDAAPALQNLASTVEELHSRVDGIDLCGLLSRVNALEGLVSKIDSGAAGCVTDGAEVARLWSEVHEDKSLLQRLDAQVKLQLEMSEQHKAAGERRMSEEFYSKRDIDGRFAQVWWRLNEAKKVRLTQNIQTQNAAATVGSRVARPQYLAAAAAMPRALPEEARSPMESVEQQWQPPMPAQHGRADSVQQSQSSALPEGVP